MAKCSRCGRKGFFLKVGKDGLCADCSRLVALQEQEKRLQKSIQNLEAKLSDEEKLYQEVLAPLQERAEKEINQSLLEKQAKLDDYLAKIDEKDSVLRKTTEKLERTEKSLATSTNKLQKNRGTMDAIAYAVNAYHNFDCPVGEIDKTVQDAEQVLNDVTVKIQFHCMDVKTLRKQFKKNEKKIETVLSSYEGRYTTKANATIYRLMVIALKAELQNILYSINYGKLDSAVESVKAVTAKYLNIATDGNQSIVPTMKRFIAEIEYYFVEAVKIEYEYFVQKERIKEEQRAIREQMRQEAEERKLLEQQKKQMEKEENKYKTEISNLENQLSSTTEQQKIAQLQARMEELMQQLSAVQSKKDEIVHLQNGKAGYVYIISNLGSFGDSMFKVGMTRRLDPQERINELGNASVPFPFDVHSFIFSDDAVGLENRLHKILHGKRVNKVNLRKEFFHTTLDELENIVAEIDPSAEFKKTMLAEQYYQSLSVDEVPDEIDFSDDDEELIEDVS